MEQPTTVSLLLNLGEDYLTPQPLQCLRLGARISAGGYLYIASVSCIILDNSKDTCICTAMEQQMHYVKVNIPRNSAVALVVNTI